MKDAIEAVKKALFARADTNLLTYSVGSVVYYSKRLFIMKRTILLALSALLLTSCIGGGYVPVKLSDTALVFGPDGGEAVVSSNVYSEISDIKDSDGKEYSWEYIYVAGRRRRKTEWLDANGLSGNDSGGRQITIRVSPSDEPGEWTVNICAFNNGFAKIRVIRTGSQSELQ